MRNLWPFKVDSFLFWSQHGIQTSPGLSKKLMTSSSPNYPGHFTSERQLTAKENGTSQLSSIIRNISTTYLSSKYKQEQSKNHQRIITVPKLKAITKSKPIIRSHESPSHDFLCLHVLFCPFFRKENDIDLHGFSRSPGNLSCSGAMPQTSSSAGSSRSVA